MDAITNPNFNEYEHCEEDNDNLSLSTMNSIQCSEQLDELHSQQEKALKRIRALYREIIGSCPTTKQMPSVLRDSNKNLLIASNDSLLKEFSKTNIADEFQSCALIHNDMLLGVMEKPDSLHSSQLHLQSSRLNVQSETPSVSIKTKERPFHDNKKTISKGTVRISKGTKDDYGKDLQASKKGKEKVSEKMHEWPLNITVPEPFKMTLREILEKDKRELKKKQLTEKWQKSLKDELNTKIHANPVPAHVHLPLYQKMVENYERKKKERKDKSIEKTKTIFRPFNFTLKQEGQLKKSSSVPNLSSENFKEHNYFKAKPIPREVLDQRISQQLAEEEERRKIRISQRAKNMLENSSSPFSSRNTLKKFSSLTNLSEDTKDSQKDNRKSKNNLFEHIRHSKENLNTWEPRLTTVCQPFNLSTNRKSSGKINKTKEDDMYHSFSYSSLPETKRMCSSRNTNSSLSVSPRSFSPEAPIKMNITALLREHQVRKELEEKENMRREEDRKKEGRAKREIELQKTFVPKFRANDPTLYKKYSIEDKVKNYREASLMRQMEYKQELKEIQDRVEKKPLLVERQTMSAAKHQIEKQFQDKLKEAGLDMDFVQMKSEKFSYSLADSDLFNADDECSSHGRRSGSSCSLRTQSSEEYASDQSNHTQSSSDVPS